MFETRKEEASVEEIRELKERLERERPVEWEAFPDIGQSASGRWSLRQTEVNCS